MDFLLKAIINIFKADTLLFLATHNFDFNKLFYEGIFSLSEESEKLLSENKAMKFYQEKIAQLDSCVSQEMTDFTRAQSELVRLF